MSPGSEGASNESAGSRPEPKPASGEPSHIFWRADTCGEWIEAIPPWGDFTGLEPREARGDTWLELLHPDDRERTADLWKRCVATREPYRNEYRLRRPGGGWRHIAVRGVPMLAADGSVREWIGMSEDITESRLDRQALAHERVMLDQLVRGGSLPAILEELVRGHERLHPGTLGSVLLCDAEGKRLFVGAAPGLPDAYSKAIEGAAIGPNAGSCGTAAFTGETVIVSDIETDPKWAEFKSHALAHGLRACWSTPIRSRGGKVIGTFALYYREARTPHPEELAAIETGARLASVAIERRLEEDAVREWKGRYEALIHASGHLLYDWDPATNRVAYAGDSRRVLGYPMEELGSTLAQWTELVHPEDRAAFQREVERCLETGAAFHGAYRVRRKDGVYVDVQDDGYFVRNAEGEVTRMLGFVVDVTERKRSDEQARQTQKMNAIGELAGGVAHDFNNQLAAMLGNADLLSRHVMHPDQLRLVEGIAVAARRSADLTQKLLAFARKGQYRKVAIDVHRLIAETVEILEHSIDKRISIVQRLEAEGAAISGDPSQIQNALLNLGLNARDAMQDGGTLTFETAIVEAGRPGADPAGGGRPGSRLLRIRVEDTGSGIADEVREHLFEPFFTTKSSGKGTGLGLASVYGTVSQHAGTIRVDGAEGRGTTFTIEFPLAESPALLPPPQEPVRPAETSAVRVLVVDDEEELRSLVPRMLRRSGHEGLSVADGREAVELFAKKSQEIDLVLLDMMMPGISGRETFRALQAIDPDVRVLLSSGYSIDGDAREILAQGAKGFIQKPFTVAELEAAIAKIVRSPAT